MIGSFWPAATTDPALPLLARLADPAAARGLLAELLGGPVALTGLQLVKHRPGRRCILRASLAGTPTDSLGTEGWNRGLAEPDGRDAAPPSELYLKLYATGRAVTVAQRTAACAALGACGPMADLPPVLATCGPGGLVLIGGLAGQPFIDALLQGQRGLPRRLAAALAHLHAIEAPDLPAGQRSAFAVHDAGRELRPLVRRLAELEDSRAGLASAAARAGRAVAAVVGEADRIPWRQRLLHRDLHPEQVLVAGERLSILDWDDAALGEPALDLANFGAHLRLAARCSADRVWSARLDRAAGELCAWARRLDPQLSMTVLRLLEAATLLRLVTLHLDGSLNELQAGRLLCRATGAFEAAWKRLTDDLAGR